MAECPEAGQLKSLEAGALSDDIAERLLVHTESCVLCREMLARLQRGNLDGRILRRAVREAATGVADAAPVRSPGVTKSDWDIPDYECLHLCGEGAFGSVWAVRDRVGVFRALKVIDLSRLPKDALQCRELTALESFCRQVQPHPNLIRVYHVGVIGDKLYYTMDLADDASTRKPIRGAVSERYRPLTLRGVMQGAPISPDTAIEVVLRLLRGLSHLHRVGLAHRDIKPANIVFVNRQPTLSDIGMITAQTTTPSHVGTPEYMPPDGLMDLTSDTFALGRVLYELMVGEDVSAFPKIPKHVADASDAWDMARIGWVIEQACAPNARDRFGNADHLREAIESGRLWSYDALFAELNAVRSARAQRRTSSASAILVAALNTLPWLLAFVLLLVLVMRLT
ncbi:MAG: protein kinase [Phycisphaerales bacterium]|nr:protein kinase [Phycisphaerales bacterium]